jgi:hypothetical protein
MKEKVIEFLGNPKTGSDSFNKALELYRKSKGHSSEQVRYMNNLGYSPDRLESLIYELKKLHNITDLELAKAKRKKVKKAEPENDSKVVDFVKGIMAYDSERATDEETAKAAETLRANLSLEGNPTDENNEVVSDAEFVTAVKGYFTTHDALGEAPEKTLEDLVQITEESKKQPAQKKDPKIMAIPVTDFDTVPSGADEQQGTVKKSSEGSEATLEPSEATKDLLSVTPENTDEKPSEATTGDTQATSVEHKMTSEEIDEQAKGAAAEREKFLKEDLAEFDVEEKKYNDIKSFAADLSDYINEDPKDQKGDTLKAFILDAKKKFPGN